MNPSLGITVTESVREGVRIIMFGVPCPTCGNTGKAMSLRDAAKESGVPFTTMANPRRAIDLSPAAFARLAPLSRGVVQVTLSVGGSAPVPTLPATDTAP